MGKNTDPDGRNSFGYSRLLHQMIDEKYRALLDESDDMMSITGREGNFIFVNQKLADSLGYAKNELLNMHINDIIADESLDGFLKMTRQFIKGGRIYIDDFVLLTRNKGKIHGELNSMASYDSNGRYAGAKAIFKDRTKAMEAERVKESLNKLREACLELRAANDSLMKFSLVDASTSTFNKKYLEARIREEA
ncbi:MAG TPA: PAS domain S-box protein, partial [Candidatus Omnitrophota bacterium]|nr:PAS domain S-box protein [Candidatus Omnitrophota bacterium]